VFTARYGLYHQFKLNLTQQEHVSNLNLMALQAVTVQFSKPLLQQQLSDTKHDLPFKAAMTDAICLNYKHLKFLCIVSTQTVKTYSNTELTINKTDACHSTAGDEAIRCHIKPSRVYETVTWRQASRVAYSGSLSKGLTKLRKLLLLLYIWLYSKQIRRQLFSGLYRVSQEKWPDFVRVFLMLNYTDITQNTYIQSWTVKEIMAREVW